MTRDMHQSDLAFRLLLFGITLAAAGFLYVVIDPAIQDIFNAWATHTDTSAASTGRGYMQDAWNAAPFIVLFLAMIGLLARAIAQSRRTRGGGGL